MSGKVLWLRTNASSNWSFAKGGKLRRYLAFCNKTHPLLWQVITKFVLILISFLMQSAHLLDLYQNLSFCSAFSYDPHLQFEFSGVYYVTFYRSLTHFYSSTLFTGCSGSKGKSFIHLNSLITFPSLSYYLNNQTCWFLNRNRQYLENSDITVAPESATGHWINKAMK